MTIGDGSFIEEVKGRYKMVDTSNWYNFKMDLTNPRTPDITMIGNYDMQVKVINDIGQDSAWSDTVNFEVSTDCSPAPPPVEFSITCPDKTFNTYPDNVYSVTMHMDIIKVVAPSNIIWEAIAYNSSSAVSEDFVIIKGGIGTGNGNVTFEILESLSLDPNADTSTRVTEIVVSNIEDANQHFKCRILQRYYPSIGTRPTGDDGVDDGGYDGIDGGGFDKPPRL